MEQKKARGKLELKVQVNGKKKYRVAKLSVVFTKVTLSAPPARTVSKDGYLPNVEVWAMLAIERKSPKNTEPIKWMLLTNIPINNVEEAIEKVTWYSYRWNIEVFHKILKSGCSVEKAQLRDGRKLKKYIIIKSMIAWRIFWLTRTFEQEK